MKEGKIVSSRDTERSLSEEDKMRIRRLPPKLRKETLVEESFKRNS